MHHQRRVPRILALWLVLGLLVVSSATLGATHSGVLTQPDSAITGPFTIRTVIQFPERSTDFAGAWLAGVSTSPDGADPTLAVAFSQVKTGWFPMWGVQLVGSPTILPQELGPQSGTGMLDGMMYVRLSNISAPLWGHAVETVLSFEPDSGVLSIWIRNDDTNEAVYSGHFVVGTLPSPLYPVASDTAVASLSVTPYFTPRSLEWTLTEVATDTGVALPIMRIDRKTEHAIGLTVDVPGSPEGTVSFRLQQGDQEITLLEAANPQGKTFHPIDPNVLFGGTSTLTMQYVLDGQVLFEESRELRVGRVTAVLDPWVQTTDAHGVPVLAGSVSVVADGPLPDFTLTIDYDVKSPGTSAPLHAGWLEASGTFNLPIVGIGDAEVRIPYALPLDAHPALKQSGERFVELVASIDTDAQFDLKGPSRFVVGERVPVFPKVGDYTVLRGDFHIHTTLSDGKLSPGDRLWESYMYGYDIVAITDHRNFSAYDLVKELAERIGAVLIRGFETGRSDGTSGEHLVVLDIDPAYRPRDEHNWAVAPGGSRVFYQDQVREIIEHGGYFIYAHPGGTWLPAIDYDHPEFHLGWTDMIEWMIAEGYLHGVEIRGNYGAERRDAPFRWALDYGLTMIDSTDVHDARNFGNPQASPVTLVFVAEATADGVMAALREGRTLILRNGQLRGKTEWLEPFIEAMVSVETTIEDGQGYIVVENRGPVSLMGMMRGERVDRVSLLLRPYSTERIPCGQDVANFEVVWTNVLSAPNTLFATSYQIEW